MIEKGNYYLAKLSTYECTFCNSDCSRVICQRNLGSDTCAYFNNYKGGITFKDDFSPYCTMYQSPAKVINNDVV